jgi:hypothetical protein
VADLLLGVAQAVAHVADAGRGLDVPVERAADHDRLVDRVVAREVEDLDEVEGEQPAIALARRDGREERVAGDHGAQTLGHDLVESLDGGMGAGLGGHGCGSFE